MLHKKAGCCSSFSRYSLSAKKSFIFFCPDLSHCGSPAVNIYDYVKSCKRFNLHIKYMLLLVKFSIASFTFCMSSRYDKYLVKHVNSSEIDAEKQNKTLVQRKQITTETSPRFNLLI